MRPAYLYVDVSTIVDQKLQAQRSVGGGSGEVQRSEALIVGLADIGAVVDELADDSVLTVKTRHVQRCVPKPVGLVDLLPRRDNKVIPMSWRTRTSERGSSPPPRGLAGV